MITIKNGLNQRLGVELYYYSEIDEVIDFECCAINPNEEVSITASNIHQIMFRIFQESFIYGHGIVWQKIKRINTPYFEIDINRDKDNLVFHLNPSEMLKEILKLPPNVKVPPSHTSYQNPHLSASISSAPTPRSSISADDIFEPRNFLGAY